METVRPPPNEEYRARRKAIGMTQSQLADELGLGRDTIVARELGKSRLVDEHFHALRSIELACKALEHEIQGAKPPNANRA